MTVRRLFPTLLHQAPLGDEALLVELERSVRALAQDDIAGRRWSKAHGYKGYTSYASLDDLPRRDPAFAELKRLLDRQVAAFGQACAFELSGRRLKLDSLWANLLRPGGHHGAHLHPHSVVSGTLYVSLPEGSGAIRFEDPRLAIMMAAPTRRDDVDEMRTFVTVEPRAGDVLLWESWLRHEVLPHGGRAERISVSFNYRW